jgi:general secretion pathway protein G
MKRNAFSLVELLIVIVVISVLAAIIVPKVREAGLQSREAALKRNLQLYRGAVSRFIAKTGTVPSSLSVLADPTIDRGMDRSLAIRVFGAGESGGPYLDKIEPDPVSGAPLQYLTFPDLQFKLMSSAAGTASDGTNYSDW